MQTALQQPCAGVRRACQRATAGRCARQRTLFVVRAAPACAAQGEAHPAPAAPRLLRRQALAAAAAAAAGLALSPAAQAAEACELVKAPNGMQFCDLVEGTGDSPVAGAMIRAHYEGKLASNGAVFDSSYERGRPLTFKIGVRQVIQGWDQGILGAEDIPPMKAGGKRRLVIPPELAYGERGAGGVIPPNATLVFDVELLGKYR